MYLMKFLLGCLFWPILNDLSKVTGGFILPSVLVIVTVSWPIYCNLFPKTSAALTKSPEWSL